MAAGSPHASTRDQRFIDGFRTAPNAALLQVPPYASSCIFVLPRRIAPAENNDSTAGALAFGRCVRSAGVPADVGAFAVSILSFIATGKPCSGPRSPPDLRRLSAATASSNTRVASRKMNAFSLLCLAH